MQAKTLKHKTLPDTYGWVDVYETEVGPEIGHCSNPYLQPMTATMDGMVAMYANAIANKQHGDEILKQLLDYDLITVQVIEI